MPPKCSKIPQNAPKRPPEMPHNAPKIPHVAPTDPQNAPQMAITARNRWLPLSHPPAKPGEIPPILGNLGQNGSCPTPPPHKKVFKKVKLGQKMALLGALLPSACTKVALFCKISPFLHTKNKPQNRRFLVFFGVFFFFFLWQSLKRILAFWSCNKL